MVFSYEHYMNLLFHLDNSKETVPPEIAKRIISNAIAPVITVTSTPLFDKHIQETYKVDSLYMLLQFFGGCVSDRDQANEAKVGQHEHEVCDASDSTDSIPKNKNLEVPNLSKKGSRSRSNSLFQRDSTQSQYIRFTRPLGDLIETRDANDMLFNYHSLEVFLDNYLKLVAANTDEMVPHNLLKKSIYHSFFSLAISSTNNLSPYETFNHPILSLIALDISNGEVYEDARDLLVNFKNLNHNTENFPIFMNTNEMLPVFLLCYNDDSQEEFEKCQALAKKLKKQLFVESILLALWKDSFIYDENSVVQLHQPVMSSLEEILFFLQAPTQTTLSLALINSIYDMLDYLVYDLMIPFMKRKVSFWEETILQPRKSLFNGAKFFKKFMNKNPVNGNHQHNSLTRDSQGNEYFASSSSEFLMRKLADWSMMLSDFKTAYSTYESLMDDLDAFPKYLASCIEWCAVSLLMGAQSIVTVKMIKNDINPLIERALATYENCSRIQRGKGKESNSLDVTEPVRSYETRCMILASELFLSLSDTWTSTPYAIQYLETILDECKLGPCSQIMVWERLSDCYNLRVDPRIKHRVGAMKKDAKDTEDLRGEHKYSTDHFTDEDILSEGLTRRRKAAFFRLIAAKKWAEQKQWRQLSWCLKDIESTYSEIKFLHGNGLILNKLKNQLNLKDVDSAPRPSEKNLTRTSVSFIG
ncbi:BFH_HP2_G0009320.mRNA.1.CDS.1 [Saccharomyces cerevisiae]|nr:BFH_HP2_G0009320.mRNA.1.CDS.1 [Saccharomyces cerevisiae]CAI6428614.1 BFH_HP2_G0009320.mRNA.1.CDS.1 [Saccharomyces cerevisiae]CAI6432765.1 BFH_HP1_G0009540.mRNA.1.CDS.1 [Saccharomyces cerevisiae]